MTDLPLFPLHAVLFPGGRLPLRLFEQRYLEMSKACLRDGAPFGVCLIREGREVGDPAVPAEVGTLARIAQWDMPQLGVLHVVAVGGERFRLLSRRVQADGLARGDVALLPADTDGPIPPHCAGAARLLGKLAAEQPALFEPPLALASASWIGARLAELLPLPLALKQELLEISDGAARLERIQALLEGAAAGS